MFAVLGDIVFETLTAPNRLDRERHWDYVEQRVVEDLPRLQWIGDGLETINFEMLFHASFCNPSAQLMALETAASDHLARALVFGNGDHRGYFVITALGVITEQMSQWGDPLAVRVRVELKQWALTVETNSALLPIPSFTPIGVVPAALGVATKPIVYSTPSGVSAATSAAAAYIAPALAAVGVSPLLANPGMVGASSPAAIASDVPTTAIVRTAA
ncbi:MAG: phage tail protein [Candidatus Binataceae bacterium]